MKRVPPTTFLKADGSIREPETHLVNARSTSLVRHEPVSAPIARLLVDEEEAQKEIDASISPNTRRAYEFELHCFTSWCSRRGLRAEAPTDVRTLRVYLLELAKSGRSEEDLPPQKQKRAPKIGGLRVGSVLRALGAICVSHTRVGETSPWHHPKIKELRVTLGRLYGTRPIKKTALERELMVRLVSCIPTGTLIGLRDRAMILLGWHGAKRRSEVVGAHVAHFDRSPTGMRWLIPKSKTDQEGKGFVLPISFADDAQFCAILALDEWLDRSGIKEGPVFRAIDRFGHVGIEALNGEVVALRVKRYAKIAKLDPKLFAGHSLRSGWITTAAKNGRDGHAIRRVSGHQSQAMVDEYIQHASVLENAPGKGLI